MTPLSIADRIVETARSQLGVVEERGNKGVPYERYALTGEDPLPWCARFVRWVFTQNQLILPGNRYLIGRVSTMQEELVRRGAILTRDQSPEPGDLVFLHDRGGSDAGGGHHVAIIESRGATTVNSIDGNWGDRVKKVARDRYAPAIWCYARWPVQATA